jgi:hypothetical protein
MRGLGAGIALNVARLFSSVTASNTSNTFSISVQTFLEGVFICKPSPPHPPHLIVTFFVIPKANSSISYLLFRCHEADFRAAPRSMAYWNMVYQFSSYATSQNQPYSTFIKLHNKVSHPAFLSLRFYFSSFCFFLLSLLGLLGALLCHVEAEVPVVCTQPADIRIFHGSKYSSSSSFSRSHYLPIKKSAGQFDTAIRKSSNSKMFKLQTCTVQ